jgi:hypothetical protein
MMNESQVIPADILPYFEEIAERLWSGHASVMVGARFSKNAELQQDSTFFELDMLYS